MVVEEGLSGLSALDELSLLAYREEGAVPADVSRCRCLTRLEIHGGELGKSSGAASQEGPHAVRVIGLIWAA